MLVSISWSKDSWFRTPLPQEVSHYEIAKKTLPDFGKSITKVGIIDGNTSSYKDVLKFVQIKRYRKAIFSEKSFVSDGHAQAVIDTLIESMSEDVSIEVYHCVINKLDLTFSIHGCLKWLQKESVEVINLSLDFRFISQSEYQAFKEIEFLKIPIIKSAGNENEPAAGLCAMYQNVYCIGALNEQGLKADYSNYGNFVFDWAKGTTRLGKKGTSFAAPVFLRSLILKTLMKQDEQ